MSINFGLIASFYAEQEYFYKQYFCELKIAHIWFGDGFIADNIDIAKIHLYNDEVNTISDDLYD